MSVSHGTCSKRATMRPCAILVMLLAALAGCAHRDSRVVTVAGQTYVVFRGLNRDCIQKGIVKELADHAWTITSTSESQIVAHQPAPAWINTAVLLASFDPPQVSMTLTIVPSGPDVKVLIGSGAIIDPKSSKPRVEPIQTTAQMTQVFNNSVRRIEQNCGG
jgi:hypothetical protein